MLYSTPGGKQNNRIVSQNTEMHNTTSPEGVEIITKYKRGIIFD